MPTPILNAYAEQLPRIVAEESLIGAQVMAVGTGSLKKGEGRRIARDWQRLAQKGSARDVVVRPKTAEQYRAQMAMAGIAVKTVAVKRDE